MNKRIGSIICIGICLALFSSCGTVPAESRGESRQGTPRQPASETSAAKTQTNAAAETSQAAQISTSDEKTGASAFADMNARVGAGLLFDNKGSLFAARDRELLKITPDGSVSTFCSFKDLPRGFDYYFSSPLIWDMTFDREGNILAAAQDRILRISPDGRFATPVEEEFGGFVGASGIETDQKGNIYITNGGKIDKYSPDFKKSKIPFIDAGKGETAYYSFFSLEFDPEYKNLYVTDFNTKTLLRYAVKPDGKVSEKPDIVVQEPIEDSGAFGAPLNMAFTEKGDLYVSIDGMSQVMKIDTGGTRSFLKLGNQLSNHIIAFGRGGFDEDCLYFTTYEGKSVYKYAVGEKGTNK